MSSLSILCSSVVTLISVSCSNVDNEEYRDWNLARDNLMVLRNFCLQRLYIGFYITYVLERAVSFVNMAECWLLSADTCCCSFVIVPCIALSLVWTSCISLVSVTSVCWFVGPRKVREWLKNNKYCSMDAMRFNHGCSPITVAFRNSSFFIRSTSTWSWQVTDVVRIWIEFAMLFIFKARSVVFAMLDKRWYSSMILWTKVRRTASSLLRSVEGDCLA